MSGMFQEFFRAADLARSDGNQLAAEEALTHALALEPFSANAIKQLIDLRRQEDADLIDLAASAFEQYPEGAIEQGILLFGMAKALDDLGDYPRAWATWVRANEIERAHVDYDEAHDLAIMNSNAKAFKWLPEGVKENADYRPIFIVGLPRSGSTLLERALSNHPLVSTVGESPALPDCLRVMVPWPEDAQFPKWRQVSAQALADEYLTLTAEVRVGETAWIDKQLLNFCYVPQILSMFPNARIIHMEREAKAAMFAMYRQRFPGTWPFTYRLNEIAGFMRAYRALMQKWNAITVDRIITVKYEELVTDFPAIIKDILEWLELPYDARCVDYTSNPAPVRTMSALQVREPLNARGLTHWRNYAEYLEPWAVR